MAYQIITDSSCDLSPELVKEKQLHVVPFYISFDEENYFKENEEIKVHEFYQKMVDHPDVFPKTSLPSVEDYMDAFTPYLQQKIDIICICITTKFSGSYNSASTARDILLEDYPDAKITVIDATVNTVLQGILVLEAVRMKEDGLSYEEVIEEIDRINILNASILAMHRALDQLAVRPAFVIVDGNRFKPYGQVPHQTIVKGDGKYLSIAAASVLAKTYRDDFMSEQARSYPQYGWDGNAGYPTRKHREAIREYGITPLHRRTFRLI